MLLQGKQAIITGASGGIGLAITEEFARQGAHIWACASHCHEGFAERLQALATQYQVEIAPVYFDLTDAAAVKEAVRTIIKAKQPIDILVNNAGAAEYQPFLMLRQDALQKMMTVNFFGPLQFTQLLARRMGRQREAAIVFVSSVAGLRGESGNLAYGASKAAVAHAVKVLSRELAPSHIRVNGVAPGMVNTEMKQLADQNYWQQLVEQVYLKREAEPAEIARVIAFLASDAASYVNGQVIRVAGGLQ